MRTLPAQAIGLLALLCMVILPSGAGGNDLDQPSSVLFEARTALDNGAFEHASEEFNRLLGKASEPSSAVAGWCRAMRRLGRVAEIHERFEAAWSQAPGSPGAALGLGLAFFYEGKTDQAERWFRKSHRLYARAGQIAGRAEALTALGVTLTAREHPGEALENLTEALALRRAAGDDVALAETLTNLAGAQLALGMRDEAERAYREALTLFEQEGLAGPRGVILSNLGVIRLGAGELPRAAEAFEGAVRIAEERNDNVGLANGLINLAVVRERQADYRAALETATRAAKAADAVQDPALRSSALVVMGNSSLAMGDLTAARKALEEARRLGEETGRTASHADALTGLGNVAMAERDVPAAQDLYRRSLSLHEEADDSLGQATDWSNLGAAFEDQDLWAEAADAYARALDLFSRAPDAGRESRLLCRLAGVEQVLGRAGRAEARLVEALRLAVEAGDLSQQAAATAQMGHLFQAAGKLDEALARYREAAQIHSRLGQKVEEGNQTLNAGEALRLMGRWEEATRLYEEARRILEQAGATPDLAIALHDLGLVAAHDSRVDEALALLKRAEGIQRDYHDVPGLIETLVVEGSVLEKAGRLRDARAALEAALDLEHGMMARAGGADLATGLQGEGESPARALALLLARVGRMNPEGKAAQEAFLIFQEGRARALRRLTRAPVGRLIGEDPVLRERWSAAQRTIANHRTRLREGGLSAAERAQSLEAIERAESGAASILREAERHTSGTETVQEDSITVESIQGRLSAGEALIGFLLADPASYGWVLTRNRFRQIELTSAGALSGDIVSLVSALDPRSPPPGPTDPLASSLGASLLEPLLHELRAETALWLVPDGALLRLPMDALRVRGARSEEKADAAIPSSGSDTPLALLYYTTVLPSAVSLPPRSHAGTSSLVQGPASGPAVLAFGAPYYGTPHSAPQGPKWSLSPGGSGSEVSVTSFRSFYDDQGFELQPLPRSRQEVTSLERMYPAGTVRVLTGKAAREESFKSADLFSARIIHLATHALIDRDVVERSAVVFSLDADPREDGFLTVPEIQGLRLGPSMVILSACSTAGVRGAGSEGLLGLARAFLAAGARAVVASLWPVEDQSTARFMSHLHRSLSAGHAAADALTAARRAMIEDKDPRFSSPRAWSAFVLIGDGGFVPFPRPAP